MNMTTHDVYLILSFYPASVNLKLAQKFYQKRILELYDLIAEEESKFKCAAWINLSHFSLTFQTRRALAAEIEDIRAGKWDENIKGTAMDEPIADGETEPVNAPPTDSSEVR
jgi:hypothetical protein